MRRVSVAAGRGSGTARAARAGGTRTSTSNTRVSRPWHRSQSSTPSFGWRNGWPWASASASSLQAVHLPSVAISRSVSAPRAEPVGAEVPRRLPLGLAESWSLHAALVRRRRVDFFLAPRARRARKESWAAPARHHHTLLPRSAAHRFGAAAAAAACRGRRAPPRSCPLRRRAASAMAG